MSNEQREIHIYTDGSCLENPGNGGYAAIILDGESVTRIAGHYPKTTNQRMEILATVEGMAFFKDKQKLHIYSDSAYVCNCYKKKWYTNWQSNGWKNAKGDDVANKDLWERFISLVEFHDVEFHKVKGHTDNIGNNECDKYAREITTFAKYIKRALTV